MYVGVFAYFLASAVGNGSLRTRVREGSEICVPWYSAVGNTPGATGICTGVSLKMSRQEVANWSGWDGISAEVHRQMWKLG